jgi:hypothetical protein
VRASDEAASSRKVHLRFEKGRNHRERTVGEKIRDAEEVLHGSISNTLREYACWFVVVVGELG